MARADRNAADAGTRIAADALSRGNGGRVIVWSDRLTIFQGQISARGGPEGGDGGFAEVSGKQHLAFAGKVDLRAPVGAAGMLLLDPIDVLISNEANQNIIDFGSGDADFFPTDTPSILNATVLQTQLGLSNVAVNTQDFSGGSDAGNITVAVPLSWGSANLLTLNADNDVFINGAITADAGGLSITAGGDVSATAAVSVGTFELFSGNWVQEGPNLPAFGATDFFVSESASFRRSVGGTGVSNNPFLVADVYGLQGINSATYDTASFALANDIDASGTANWDFGAGFDPIGDPDFGFTPFTGTFDGRGHTIDGLYIDTTLNESSDPTGLFGSVGSGAEIRNVGLTNVDITGPDQTGALVGALSTGATVENVFVSGGTVLGNDDVGGLVGHHFLDSPPSFTIRSAYADVAVEGNSNVGGLVGSNEGTVTLAYAEGSVSGVDNVGGLVGQNSGAVSQTYAVGAVSASDGDAGGLVGFGDAGLVSASFWDVDTTLQADSDGGIGLPTGDFQSAAIFVPQAEAAGWNFQTDWAPPNSYPVLYALEPVVWIVPADITAVRGSQSSGALTGQLFGGPGVYVFGPQGDSLAVAGTLSSTGIPASASGPFPNVGAYPILVADSATSDLGVAYTVVDTGPATLTITPAPLTIAALDAAKLYGTPLGFDGTEFSVAGLVPGDSVSSVTLASEGSAAGAPVAGNPYSIDAGDPQGTGLFFAGVSNYDITFVPGELTVTPAPLTITALDAAKFFGNVLTFNGTEFTAQGLVNGDSVTLVSLFSAGQAATASPAGSPYPIFVSDPQGIGSLRRRDRELQLHLRSWATGRDPDVDAAGGRDAGLLRSGIQPAESGRPDRLWVRRHRERTTDAAVAGGICGQSGQRAAGLR